MKQEGIKMSGLIMVAHGSKKDISNDEFRDLVDEIKTKNEDFKEIDTAFLEFASPTIHSAVQSQVQKKINKIYFYPYFLNSGKHVSVDLPHIIDSLEKQYSSVDFVLLTHFGKSNKISDIILNDLRDSIIKGKK